ncbi:hypothetical protein EBZ35_02925, partial [bacterium]|nr:hypothetical protein [bacterium]
MTSRWTQWAVTVALFVTTCWVGIVPLSTMAATPSLIYLEAKVTDLATGELNSGSDGLPVTFQMVHLASDANPVESVVWEETIPGVVFNSGMFAIQLGKKTPFTSAVFNYPYIELRFTVGSSKDVMTVPIHGVPAAIKAKWADEVMGLDWSKVNVVNTPNIARFPGTLTASQLPDSVVTGVKIATNAVDDSKISGV